MNNKKEQERAELHKTIWKIADELRGSVDGWDFKQYVLGLLFYRFISENIENYVNDNQRKAGIDNFNYRDISDDEALLGKQQILEEKGFFILPSELFCNIRKGADKNENLNVVISNVFNNIESSARGTASEDDVKGLFDDFTIDNKLGNTVDERNEKLVKLLNVIGDLDFGDYDEGTIDLFGDAYEFLMTMYASSAGKSGGEFFTPQEIGELLARIVIMDKTSVNKVYDPACGSGGLLLKFAKILGKDNVKQGFFGQEINLTTYNLARINMFLHNINYNNFSIKRGDTLIHPAHWDDEPFDAIVSNPPYGIHWIGKENPILINDERFAPAGVLAPSSKADLAFTMHMLSWLSPKGTAAIVEFPGVLYRGGSEQKIRQYMVDNNFVDAVIQLSSGLFFGTGIETCIIVLKKNKSDNNILFIDASNEKVPNKNKMKNATNINRLSSENIDNIIELYKNRKTIDNETYLASYEEIVNNEYNLSINSYIKQVEENEVINSTDIIKDINSSLSESNDLRKQIENILLEIKNINKDNNINYISISEISNTFTGLSGKNKNDFENGNHRFITYTNIYNNPSTNLYLDDYVFVGENEKQNEIMLGDILIAGSSENLEDSGMISVVTEQPKEKIYLNSFCFGVRLTEEYKNKFNPKFLMYYFRTTTFRKNIIKCSFGVTRYNLNKKKFLALKIPVISIEMQNKIVDILDRYNKVNEKLINNLKIEIENRNKLKNHYEEILYDFD